MSSYKWCSEKSGHPRSFILCDPNVDNFYWEYTTTDELSRDTSDNKVAGGIEGGILLFIGRIFHEGVWKISKIIPPSSEFRGFKVWNNLNGTQYNSDDFQILKYKKHAIAPRC
ncbi:hypothetical protein QE152_g22069 [Popillia japonica]|uniref:Uncharacterized protein n=1 Tax=Popillia japonica TaxID=7064 RepID=A0AAW1KJY1_POPJA